MDPETPIIPTERCEVPVLHDAESEGCDLSILTKKTPPKNFQI